MFLLSLQWKASHGNKYFWERPVGLQKCKLLTLWSFKEKVGQPMIYVKSPEDAMNLYYFRKVGQSGENVTSDSPYFMCSRLLCDFLRTGERDLYTLLPCPSAPGSYSPTEQQSGRGCNNSIPSRDRNWQWKEKRVNCPSFNGWVSWETHSCHMEHVPSSLKEVRKEKP